MGYFEIKETVAPEGYTFNDKTYGINIDPYEVPVDLLKAEGRSPQGVIGLNVLLVDGEGAEGSP